MARELEGQSRQEPPQADLASLTARRTTLIGWRDRAVGVHTAAIAATEARFAPGIAAVEAQIAALRQAEAPQNPETRVPTAADFIDDLARLRAEKPTIAGEHERRSIVTHFITDRGQEELRALRETRPEVADATLFRSTLPPTEIAAQIVETMQRVEPGPETERIMLRERALSGDPDAVIEFFGGMRMPNKEMIVRRLRLTGHADETTIDTLDARITQTHEEEAAYSRTIDHPTDPAFLFPETLPETNGNGRVTTGTVYNK